VPWNKTSSGLAKAGQASFLRKAFEMPVRYSARASSSGDALIYHTNRLGIDLAQVGLQAAGDGTCLALARGASPQRSVERCDV